MKALILALACFSATISFAKAENCTFEHIQILNEAEGPKSESVRALLALETPNFSCEVATIHNAFLEDCGRFTYVEYNFKVKVAATTLEAVVYDGGISCTRTKRTELAKVVIKK